MILWWQSLAGSEDYVAWWWCRTWSPASTLWRSHQVGYIPHQLWMRVISEIMFWYSICVYLGVKNLIIVLLINCKLCHFRLYNKCMLATFYIFFLNKKPHLYELSLNPRYSSLKSWKSAITWYIVVTYVLRLYFQAALPDGHKALIKTWLLNNCVCVMLLSLCSVNKLWPMCTNWCCIIWMQEIIINHAKSHWGD